MKRSLSIVAAVLFALACNKAERTSHTTESTAAAAPPAAATPAVPYDLQFLDAMTHHHQMAVDMVKAAQGRFSHKELAGAGDKMVEDQQKEIAQMKAWRDQWYPGAAAVLNMNMPGMQMNMDMSHLTTMSGNELDLMFIDMMTPHHEGAVAMANDALTRAEHAEIKQLARNIIDAQQREIEQFKKWRQAWAGK